MADQLQLRGGTTAEHATFTGALREVTVDTDKDTLVVHDNAIAGGRPLLREDGSNSALTLGTAGTPSIKFTGDPNTGIYSPGADQVAISTNGSQRLLIDASGNVTFTGGNLANNTSAGVSPSLVFNQSGIGLAALGMPANENVLQFLGWNGASLIERARIDSSGRLLVGTSTATGIGSKFEVVGAAIASEVHNTANDQYSPAFYLSKARGTGAQIVSSGDGVGFIGFIGYDGTNPMPAASIEAFVDGTPGANDMPGRLVFSTTADGASSPTERMRITNSGNVGIGTTAPATKLHVAGNVKVSAASGNVELYVESGSLADGELSYIWAAGGSCQAEIGVYKHSGIGSPAAYMNLENVSGAGYFYWTDTSGNFRISSNSAHIGTTSGTVVGTQTSDARLKNVSGPVEYGLNEIKNLNPVRYALKTQPDEEKLGFLAHEVRPLVPEAVFDTKEVIPDEPEDAETKLGMEYVALIPVLVNAVKELAAEIDSLKAQLQALSTPPS